MKEMNALVLAAGRGERLRPISTYIPKPLVKINGQTVLERRIDALRAIPEIGEIGVTAWYLRDKIREFLKRKYGSRVRCFASSEVIGTAEATLNVWRTLGKEEPLMVSYADVYSMAPETVYPVVIKMYLGEEESFSVLGCRPLPDPPAYVMHLDKDSIVTEFIEHPRPETKIEDGDVASYELMIFHPSVFPILEEALVSLVAARDRVDHSPINLGDHLLPILVKKSNFHVTDVGECYDIGTVEQYCNLQQKIYNEKLRCQMSPKLHLVFNALFKSKGYVWLIGNGGSLAVAQHAALDLSKAAGRRALCASDAACITAYSNDISFAKVFSEYLANMLVGEDILIALSASGESPNILQVVEETNKEGLLTIALTRKGSSLEEMARISLGFEENDPKVLEDLFSITLHKLTRMLEDVI